MTINPYDRMLHRLNEGHQFVGCSVRTGPTRFVGMVVDDEFLPIAADKQFQPHFTSGSTAPLLCTWSPRSPRSVQVCQPGVMSTDAKQAEVIGDRMTLADLKSVALDVISRDWVHPHNNTGSLLAESVARGLVTAGMHTKLIGGMRLRQEVNGLIRDSVLDLDEGRFEPGGFDRAWRHAWGRGTKVMNHDAILELTCHVMKTMILLQATNQLALMTLVS
ncbi:MAG: hypothetical protein K0S68_715 [Candidatus Saccharibacteria bacterium]|nr:hypothetical protein [Candidatus Saccharibacteria bacterium]